MPFPSRLLCAVLAIPFLFAACGGGDDPTPSIEANAKSMDFRWTGNAGFELVLSTGEHVLIDPWLNSSNLATRLSLDNVQRADYVLITHIHGDHAADLKRIQEKFPDVKIFVGALSAEPLVKWLNLDTRKIFKVIDGQKFQFDEVTIEAFAGRHTESKNGNFMSWDASGEATAQSYGTLELFQYLVTAKDGAKFVAWAGTPSVDNAYRLAGLNPDLAGVHISPKQDFTIMSRIMNSMGVGTMMPHHYDIWPLVTRNPVNVADFPDEVQPITPDNVIQRMMPYVERTLNAAGTNAKYFVPEAHKWYHFDGSTNLNPM